MRTPVRQIAGNFHAMTLQVLLAIRVVGKCARTMGALIWPFAGMLSYVYLQARALDKCARAVRAFVRPLTRMAAHVHRQVVRLGESL